MPSAAGTGPTGMSFRTSIHLGSALGDTRGLAHYCPDVVFALALLARRICRASG